MNQDILNITITEPISDNVCLSAIDIVNDEGNFSLNDLASEYLADNGNEKQAFNFVTSPIVSIEIKQLKETELTTMLNLSDLENDYVDNENDTKFGTALLASPSCMLTITEKSNRQQITTNSTDNTVKVTTNLQKIDDKKVSLEDILFSVRLVSNDAVDNCKTWTQPSVFGQVLCALEKTEKTIVNSIKQDSNTFFNHDLYEKLFYLIHVLSKHGMRRYQTQNKSVRNNDNKLLFRQYFQPQKQQHSTIIYK
ncbi:unnamed protein product [Didymodactylos carnosus]|uniref:Uncharacterized protein n=1 Tax=Didymodactylos carnosus TaxID=1234261 RepID=A0A813VIB2_9BILA|nr:unnamed protein product [Didymodactylos carnosus]CAF1358033.1 unnamed protein product [Didymodactylos carnosus]CAF3631149.1 unnamed protein product [Didymodactylos carnosus]CAF4168408.1 unnamed protein product [Didymodactylos carnosus]